jgi:hypothetical protein
MYQLIDVSYGGHEPLKDFYSFGEAYGAACDLLRGDGRRLQIVKDEIIKWDSRDGINEA